MALTREELLNQRKHLLQQVFVLQTDECLKAFDPAAPRWADPDLAASLEQLFTRNHAGKLEKLRQEIDLLRRVSLSKQSEWVIRPYGVVEIAVPVVLSGKVQYCLLSGPLKISVWSERDFQTLAKLTGLPTRLITEQFGSDRHAYFWTENAAREWLHRTEVMADLLAANVPETLETRGNTSSSPLEVAPLLAQPGLADHLDVLMGVISRQCRDLLDQVPAPSPMSEFHKGLTRIAGISQRSHHLLQSLLEQKGSLDSQTVPLHVYTLLDSWLAEIERRVSHVRITRKYVATEDTIHAVPHQIEHLLYTTLMGVVDGLGTTGGYVGISTRNVDHKGIPCVHIEIRDSGGQATFAGDEPALMEQLHLEQNELSQDYADWIALAEQSNASLHISQDDQIVTRVDLYVSKLAPAREVDLASGPNRHVWVVDEDPNTSVWLTEVLGQSYAFHAYSSGKQLQDEFASAPVPPDLIILDAHLNDVRSMELRRWIYSMDAELPVVVTSSLANTHPGIARATALRRTMYLQKPYDARELQDHLEMALGETLLGE